MGREQFKSRLGFVLISAGCAIGIGNVWRFPYVVGNNGGGIFVIAYLFFLITFGVPILTMEYAIGRASRKSIVRAYQQLEPEGSKWHLHGYLAFAGNYILMFFYTVVTGWMFYYFFRFLRGGFTGLNTAEVEQSYDWMLSRPGTMIFWMILAVFLGIVICSMGLQKGVERITKWMMLILLGLIFLLAVHSMTLKGGLEGLKFYLYPDIERVRENGLLKVIVAAMNQAFFTLSIGIGSMMIFGSYLDKKRTLLGESITVAGLDTFVAITAGLIIFPACFAYGINPDSGPKLIFITLPSVFNGMAGGRIWGTCFFLFMSFASLSTVIAVFENIICCSMERWKLSRKRAAVINFIVISLGSIPCVLGYNIWKEFQPFGPGSNILDLEDFLVSSIMLPIGTLIILFFCTRRHGWSFENYFNEVNQGSGPKMAKALRFYLTWILPVLIIVLIVDGIIRR